MVYKKQYRRKPRSRSRYQNYAGAGNQLVKDVRLLKALVNVEEKVFNFSTVVNPDWSGLLTTINVIPQGDTDGARDGDSLKMQKLRLNMQISNTRIALARVLVIFDPQNKCATVGDILQDIGSAVAPLSFKDYDKRFNCKVLYDHVFRIDPNMQNIFAKVKLHIGKHTQYEATTTTINSGALKLLVIGDSSTNESTVRYNWRLTYTDN